MSTNGASSNVGTTATDVGDFTTSLLDINSIYTFALYPTVWVQFYGNNKWRASADHGAAGLPPFCGEWRAVWTENSIYIGDR